MCDELAQMFSRLLRSQVENRDAQRLAGASNILPRSNMPPPSRYVRRSWAARGQLFDAAKTRTDELVSVSATGANGSDGEFHRCSTFSMHIRTRPDLFDAHPTAPSTDGIPHLPPCAEERAGRPALAEQLSDPSLGWDDSECVAAVNMEASHMGNNDCAATSSRHWAPELTSAPHSSERGLAGMPSEEGLVTRRELPDLCRPTKKQRSQDLDSGLFLSGRDAPSDSELKNMDLRRVHSC